MVYSADDYFSRLECLYERLPTHAGDFIQKQYTVVGEVFLLASSGFRHQPGLMLKLHGEAL